MLTLTLTRKMVSPGICTVAVVEKQDGWAEDSDIEGEDNYEKIEKPKDQ
jgi:hypothetical protein